MLFCFKYYEYTNQFLVKIEILFIPITFDGNPSLVINRTPTSLADSPSFFKIIP